MEIKQKQTNAMKDLISKETPMTFENYDLNYRVQYLKNDMSNAWLFVLVSLINYTCNHKELLQSLKHARPHSVLKTIRQLKFDYKSSKLKHKPSFCLSYQVEELLQIKKYKDNPKVQNLQSFIQKEKNIWDQLSVLLNFGSLKYTYDFSEPVRFREYAVSKLETKAISYGELEEKINKLLNHMESLQIEEWLGFHDENSCKEILESKFDFAKYKRPLLLEPYPQDLREYKLLLKGWLQMEIINRQRKLGFSLYNLPMSYKYVFDYAENLLDEEEKKFLQEDESISQNYPAHIFPSFKSFKLFDIYAKQDFKNVVYTYLFRKFESSKDPLYKIGVSPAAFKEWYRSQYPEKDYLEISASLKKSESEEREQNFYAVKSLIDKLYDL